MPAPMSIPHYDGREARYRLEMIHQQRCMRDEDEHIMTTLGELGKVHEEFEDEQRYEQACSQEGATHENI